MVCDCTALPWLGPVFQPLFALAFIGFRLVYWPIWMVPYWSDSIAALQGGKGRVVVVLFYLLANAFMTGLQVMWGYKIVKMMLRAVSGAPKSSPTSTTPKTFAAQQ